MPRHKVLSLEEIARIYEEDCRVQGLMPATIAGYQRTLRCYLRWAKEEERMTTLPEFTAEAVKRFIAYTQQRQTYEGHPFTPEQQQRVSATTVRNYTRDLKAFATWLERETYTAENVLSRVRKPKADEIPITPFSQEELNRIFGAFDLTDAFELRDYVILHTPCDTGMRCPELVALTLDDVDLKQGEIRIDHAKWGKWRDIGFGKQTQKYLSRYLSVCRPEPAVEGDRHFFLSIDGYPLTVSLVDQLCQRVSKRWGCGCTPTAFATRLPLACYGTAPTSARCRS